MNTYTQEYLLRYGECDRICRLKLKGFLDLAQEVAGIHAATFGCDTLSLHLQQQCWLLSRIKFRIHSYPRIGDAVRLVTYPAGFDRLFAVRETHFEDVQTGAPLAECTALWLIADTARQRILPASKVLSDILPENRNLPVTFHDIGKIPLPEGITPSSIELRKIQESQIDLNFHLNNAEYATLVQDALGPGRYPLEFQLNYQKAVPPGSTLKIYTYLLENQFQVIGKFNTPDETVAFECGGILA